MNLTTSQIISKSFRDLFQKEIRNIIENEYPKRKKSITKNNLGC